AGRAVEKEPFRHLRAEPLEPLRVAEEVHDLHQLATHLLHAGHVGPRRLRLRLGRLVDGLDPRHHPDRLPEDPRRECEQEEEGKGEPGRGEVRGGMKPVPDHASDSSAATAQLLNASDAQPAGAAWHISLLDTSGTWHRTWSSPDLSPSDSWRTPREPAPWPNAD